MLSNLLLVDEDAIPSPMYGYDSQRQNPKWLDEWESMLTSLVSNREVMGLLGISPEGEIDLFDTSLISIQRCAAKSIEVRPVRFAGLGAPGEQT